MHFFSDLGIFTAQAIIIALAILLTLAGVLALFAKAKQGESDSKNKVTVRNLNEYYNKQTDELLEQIDATEAKARRKSHKKAEKMDRPRLYVIRFDGDMKCAGVTPLRHCITAAINLARPEKDHILIPIKSAGGVVNTYGLAASQCMRIKDAKISLTIAVDEMAASGGYLMASTADQIIAAPFAIVGSIGVVMQLPNFNRLMKKHHVDFEQITAGEYKRTLTMLGENTDKDRKKCQEDVDHIHDLFKGFVQTTRPSLDLKAVATGEHWFGQRAIELNLVDQLQTSDDFIQEKHQTHDVFEIACKKKKSLKEKLATQAHTLFQSLIHRFYP